MKTVRTWCIRILMILFTVIFLYPLFWNLMSAFKTNAEYLTDPYALPTALNLDNFVAAWQKANIAAYFGNSIFVTLFSTVLLLLLVIPISYVLARYRFAGSKLISAIYMACIFLQATYIMIPLFLELQAVNGLNNLPVLCLVYAVMQFPFCIFTLQGFMSAVPRDYEESARIDGAGPVKTFTAITLPYMLFVTTPQLITQFVGNINNFNVIYLLSNGNPTTEKYYQAGQTDILVTWLFKLTMNSQDYGLAAAIGILVFVICATLSLIVYNNSKSMKDEEAFS